jgi:hypothetical protein
MTEKKTKALTRVHASLAELRDLAKRAKSLAEWKAIGRWATPEEIALAETERQPYHCKGYSSRNGLPCRLNRVYGMEVCRKHGGSIPVVKAKAALKMAGAVEPVIANMIHVATQTENLTASVKAGADLLDRAGIGEVVQAKVKSTQPRQPGEYNPDAPSVYIGMLGLHINPTPDVRKQLQNDPSAVIEGDRITIPRLATVVRSEP